MSNSPLAIASGPRAALALLAAALVALSGSGCRPRDVAQPLPVAVRVAALRSEAISADLRYSATVRERQHYQLSFKVPGTVASLLRVEGPDGRAHDVQEGDVVTDDPGRPLARLDDSDYRRRVEAARERLAQAQAKGRAAKAALTLAETTFDRIRALRESGAVAQQTFDDTTGRRDAARADLEAVEREAAAAEVALAQAEDDLRNCALVSPIPNGTVSRKTIDAGERCAAGQPIFEIMDLSQVRVAFGVPDTMVAQFRLGQDVAVTADSFRGSRFAGRVSKILPAADLKTRSFEIEVIIDEPRELKPGMVVTIILGQEETAVLAPMTAIQRSAGQEDFSVFVVAEEDGKTIARKRKVTLGGVYDNRIRLVERESEVRSGDAIVVAGAFRLTDGQQVRVLPTPAELPRTEF